ncbi:C40 family peptidase [Natronoglycomyces albus]|uniref:C40 family peptidase n=1 Tax=Natronoglycomyces albus TaxID=2811108 RepID=A0A895XLV4_9ACTN|nr:NlpC/P60 family protein [Natronoglycomyces albus]QSB03935.1 C40 family peptidase [Natronoglycomyces albus]
MCTRTSLDPDHATSPGEPTLSFASGQTALVAVSVATLWTRPDAPHDHDRLALGTPAAVRDWVSGLTLSKRTDGLNHRAITQTWLGNEVTVLDTEDTWVHIADPSQPRSPDCKEGISGWVPGTQLVSPLREEPVGPIHLVNSTATAVRDEPGGDVKIPGVTLGTRLRIAGGDYRGWAPVFLPGPQEPGWVPLRDLSYEPAPTNPMPLVSGGFDAVKVGHQLMEVPYLHSGISAYGLDAPGLVHVIYRQLGGIIPRTTDGLLEAGTEIDLDDAQSGDLLFFEHGQSKHQVSIVAEVDGTDRPTVLMASPIYGKVVQEQLSDSQMATISAVRRPIPQH